MHQDVLKMLVDLAARRRLASQPPFALVRKAVMQKEQGGQRSGLVRGSCNGKMPQPQDDVSHAQRPLLLGRQGEESAAVDAVARPRDAVIEPLLSALERKHTNRCR